MAQQWQLYAERNASRPPAWRWERAGLAASGELPVHRTRDDDWVRRAARFRRAFDHSDKAYPTACDQCLLADKWPDLYWAHHYWRQAERECRDGVPDRGRRPVAARFELEARILADADPAEIAGLTGAAPEDVVAYERLFFDVRGRLAQQSYIMTHVIGPSVHLGLSSREYDTLWKLFGYYFGPAALDFLLTTFNAPRKKLSRDAVGESAARTVRDDVLRQAMIAGKTFRLSQESQSIVIQLYQDMLKLEQSAAIGMASGADALAANLAAALPLIPHAVGKALARSPHLALLDRSGVEPDGAALVAYSVGDGPEPDPERLMLTFPQPGERT